jgi:phage FluMu protein Com
MTRKVLETIICDKCGEIILPAEGKGYSYFECINHFYCGQAICAVLHYPPATQYIHARCLMPWLEEKKLTTNDKIK